MSSPALQSSILKKPQSYSRPAREIVISFAKKLMIRVCKSAKAQRRKGRPQAVAGLHFARSFKKRCFSSLENVSKLKLTDTSRVDVADVQIAGVEPEVVERGIRYIARSWSKLRCVQ